MDKMNVAVVGDAGLDIRRSGFSSRVSPEDANCKVLTDIEEGFDLAMAGNIAQWLAKKSDLKVSLYSHFAEDTEGFILKDLCDEKGIKIFQKKKYNRPENWTTKKERICLQDAKQKTIQQLARCDRDTNIVLNKEEFDYISDLLHYSNYDLVVVADYGKGFFKGEWANELRYNLTNNKKCITVVNSKFPYAWKDNNCDALICNWQESYPLTSAPNEEERSWKRTNANYFVVTMGRGGVECFWDDEKNKFWSTSQVKGKLVDPTGAGDALTAGFAYQLLLNTKRKLPDECEDCGVVSLLHRGQLWAARCCEQIGCGEPCGDTDGWGQK